MVELLCGEFLDTVLPFDCDRSVNRDVRVVALMVLLYAGFTQVRKRSYGLHICVVSGRVRVGIDLPVVV